MQHVFHVSEADNEIYHELSIIQFFKNISNMNMINR